MSFATRLARFVGRGAPERKSITLTDPGALALFGVLPSASGPTVTASTAMRVPAVRRAVSLIAEATSALPFKVYAAETREPAKDHPAYGLVHDWASDWQSAEELREQLTIDALLTGHGFAQVARNAEGKPVYLLRMQPSAVTVETDDSGEPTYRVKLADGGEAVLAYHDVLHVQAIGGASPIVHAREAIGLCLAAEKHLASFYVKGGRPGVVIKHEKFLEEEAKRKIVNQWHATHGKENAGGIGILDENMQLEVVSGSHTDAQFLENRLEQVREIARAFNVPPALLYETSRATWSNFEQSHRDFLTGTLRPWIARWQAAYSRCLLAPDERSRLYVEATPDDLLSVEFAARATAFSQYRSMGVMTANEVRAALNRPPLPGGDKLQNPFTTTSAPAQPEEES